AARERKLIVLCITAFWCGVCQRLDETALSSEDVQLLLNAYFVPIRVEESLRPDVDLRYTRDGWPTLVFLTPNAEPLLTVNGMETEALMRILVQLVDLHERGQATSSESAAEPEVVTGEDAPDVGALSWTTVEGIKRLLASLEDHAHGGFGGPAKYFYADALLWYLRRGNEACMQHVRFTLDTLG